MNILLWVLQVVLAVKFASVAFTHGLRPDRAKMERGTQRFGAAMRPLLWGVFLLSLVGAVGVAIPAAVGVAAWLTPWAATLLAVMVLAAIALHLRCRERSKPLVGLVLLVLCAFVAYGRWVLVPF